MNMRSDGERIKTVEQVSAGGVAFRLEGNNISIAIIRTSAEGRWQLPKGMIDPGETVAQAALREVREEAGIACELLDHIDTIEYWFYGNYDGTQKRYHKKVHFYLMKYVEGNVADHDHEVIEAKWVDSVKATEILEFSNEQETVKRALNLIRSKV